jgi:5'-nucleotidase
MGSRPDLVVSGINAGPNTAMNVIYSGTVSGATEGMIAGIPSIAFSIAQFGKLDYSYSKKFAAYLGQEVLTRGLPSGTLLNVNIPNLPENKIEGVIVTRQGKARFEEYFDRRLDPSHRVYYWLAGKKMDLDTADDIDDVVITKRKVSVTPIHFDLTDHKFLEELRNWNLLK